VTAREARLRASAFICGFESIHWAALLRPLLIWLCASVFVLLLLCALRVPA